MLTLLLLIIDEQTYIYWQRSLVIP